ncbi:CshA/CshB family fibrillar adhesin-related protein [Streptococcus sanguinis]|uniref:CshA-like fibrillar surface protein C n=2 Tax=Streptococcus sanguinis TaxID=1305 RepID=A0A2X3UZV6_STRSA|nr:CshA/CshB family fibrillar adhesin-related protein [Streptococcus sanguinis]EGJ44254.1 CshA family fibrillar surface protein C [Streptococcus sanguinis SK1059]EGQ20491.1 CshA family fibrillar surface protein C [Streptococcus sanguinis ATCC 29667]SQF34530.1 CshA-like fibrillar surface protein C [Streptococcus sanguinis]
MGKDLFNPHLRKFSIRKLNVGVCSVLLSTLLLLGAAAQVSADEASDSGAQNEVSQTGIAETSVNSAETVASEHLHAKESSALPFATDTPQSDDNPSPRSSDSEKVEEPTESTATKPVENTQPITVQPETSNAAVVAEKSEATADLAQPNRSRRVRRDATPTGQQNSGTIGVPIGTGPAGADDATSKPRVPKPSLDESVKKDSVQLAKQISWLDFSDTASWKNLDQRGGLQVGTTFTKEISPGYEVTLTVTELKPFNSTETYRKRVEGTPTANTYDPNAQNDFLKSSSKYGRTPLSVIGASQDQWTTIRNQGFNTQNHKTQLVYPEDSANWGVKFNIEATYLGKRVSPTVVMADGEDANPGEFAIFTTNGEGWEYLGEWKNKSTAKEAYTVITKQMVDEADKKTRGGLLILRDKSVDWYKYLSPDTVTGGLGTQVFGPNRSNERTVPVVMTRGASEVGFYVASSGQQAMMMGFLVVDGSDAPATYGEAFHTISGRDSLTGKLINQPYLGTTPADIDVESSNDWVLDDKKEHKDEGASQLLADDQLSTSNDLLDLDKAKNGTYTIKIKANPNGNAKSYVKAWIDFNNDGVFNESEGSNLQEITAADDYTLTFNANPNITGGQVDKLGMRFRIATNKGDIEQPTGIAFSGEVEDMLLHRIYPPKGEKQTTDGFTGETQTAVLHFTPKGTDRSDDSVNAVMSTQAPQVLDKQGNALTPVDGNYIRPEGTYRLTVNGNDVQVVFTPNAEFSGIADGINIRWTDSNGTSTGWTSTDASDPNKNDQLTTMDGRYVPTVRKIPNYESSGLQGLEQNKTLVFNDDDTSSTPVTPDATHPASFVDASGRLVTENTVPAMANGQQVGTYELDPNTGQVTFKPIKTFYGTPDPVVVQVSDTDGKAHRARYQPNVTQVTPRSTNVESTGLQGQAQSGKPTFTPGDQQIPIDMSKAMTFENGTNTMEVANEGTYTINSDDTITFKPLKQFTGKATPVTVKRVDANGTEVTATYTPNVTKVTPTSTPANSSGPQGVPQTGTPVFKEGDPAVPIDYNKPMTFDDDQLKKIVAGVGEYTINSDGSITFTPDKKYVGTPAAVTVKRVDENGTEVTATYTPTVTKVTPTGTGDKTEGLQGQVQEGYVTFTPGHDSVPFPAETTPLFDNGLTVKELPNVGKFEVDANGKVTFTPDKQFKGTTPELTLIRADVNGTPVTVKYQAVVKEVVPTGTNATSTGLQGLPQSGTPTFTPGDKAVPIDIAQPMTFEDNQTTKKVDKVGTYVIESDGSITFTPEKQYVGTPAPVTVKRVDTNGTEVRATYTPTVTQVTPRSTNAESTGLQGQPQSGKPTFTPGDQAVPIDMNKPMTFENGTDTLVVADQGIYTINSDGSITFKPEKKFTGKATPVTVKRIDANGTEVTAKYTPTVEEVVPNATGDQTEGLQGLVQNGKITFEAGRPEVGFSADSTPVFDTGTNVKEIENVGKFEVDIDGNITFTPVKTFVGKTPEIEVSRADVNGIIAKAKYQATVTAVKPTGVGNKTEGLQGQVQEGQVTFTPGHDSVPFPAGSTPLFDNNSTVKEVPNVGKFEVDADGKVTFTPDKQFKGETPELELTRTDANGTPVTVKYQAVVKEVVPRGTDATSTGPQGVPQIGSPSFQGGDPLVPIDMDSPMTFDDGQPKKTVQGVGEYTINSDGTITFTPDKQYVGTPASVTVKRVDKNGTEVTATYTPTVTRVTPTSTNAESTGLQGQPQSGKPTFSPGDQAVPIDMTKSMTFENGTDTLVVANQGTYTINSDGSITFTPDKQFTGKATPIRVKRVDANGTEITATYTPEVTKVTPTGINAESTGIQGQPQKGTPTFTPGDSAVPIDMDSPMTFEDGQSKNSIPGVGVYTINSDGSITFTPDKRYVGTPNPVTVKRVDKNGTEVTATYIPTVTKVTPTGNSATSTGPQGVPQTGTPTFAGGDPLVPIDESVEPTFEDGSKEKKIPGQGTYTIAPDGVVTFTPEKQYVGTPEPVTVKRVDKNGTPVTATYSLEFTKVTPTSTNATSTGPQGLPQTGTPTFQGGDPLVPIDDTVEPTFEDGSKKKTITGQGTYTITPDGAVTFTPDKQFVGTPDPITVKRVDKNGTPVTATYSPEFTKVTPTSTNATSTGPQGLPQTGTPTFAGGDSLVPIDETVEPTFEDGSKKKTIPGQGTYTITPDGAVTFTPDKQFVGKPDPVTVKRVDKNGTPVTATYSPEFTKVTPTGTGDKTEGLQGQVQEGKVSFTPGHDSVPFPAGSTPLFDNNSTVKEVPNVGKFEVNADGKVTFTPDKQFKGETPELELTRVDANGTPITVKYQAVVKEVTPTGNSATSTGPQGVPQTGTPTFAGGDPLVPIDESVEPTFEDGSKEKKIPGQGTYTIAPDGVVTFTPEKQYVGKPDPVTVKRVDKNGTEVTATYSPEFTKVTPTGTGTKTEGLQGQVQEGKVSFTPGHNSVPFPAGSTPLFDNGSSVKEVPNVGKFEVDADGKVTFTPDKQFKGETPELELTRTDANGTPVTVKYQAVVKEVIPTSTNTTSTGPQGVPQTGTPTFAGGDPLVPIDDSVVPSFDDGSKEKTIPGQGTYTITPDGAVTFTPDKQFVGKPDSVTVKRVDKNGTPVTATYSPEFAKVTPTGKDATSTNIKGHVQTGKPVFESGNPLVPIDETIAPTFEDGSKEKTIPGEGTYTITSDGTVTFTPEADFLGQGTGVTLVRRDKNGTSVTARYIPTVVEPSTSKDSISSGRKGQAQTGTPIFEGAIDQAVAPTFADGSTEMVVPGEGTYRFNMLGAVTFVPEADFVGTARGVVVKRSDIYGNAVTATYTPTVLGSTATEDTGSTGLKGQPQTGKPIFEGDVDPTVPPTFEDGSTEKVVPGQGTYTIAPDGTVTFVPETGFVGQADGVTVIRKDRNGQTISAIYVPTVTEDPVQPERTITPAPPSLSKSESGKAFPKTGTEETSYLAASLLAGVSGLGLFGLEKRKKKSED